MKNIFLLLLLFVKSVSAQEKLEVYFDFNKSEINTKAKIKLDSLITSKNKIEILKIYGYADSVDTNKYNDSLSSKRAKSIFNYFKEAKVAISNQVEVKGFGENYSQSKISDKKRKTIIFFKSVLVQKSKPNPNNSENGSFDSSENQEILKQFLASEKPIPEKFKNAKKGNNTPKEHPDDEESLKMFNDNNAVIDIANDEGRTKGKFDGRDDCRVGRIAKAGYRYE